jgi:hypothetical protein
MSSSRTAARAFAGVAALAFPAAALAAALSLTREQELPRVCKKGPLAGQACDVDADCGGPCVVAYLPRVAFSGTLTIVVDDDVSKFDGTESVTDVVAATVLLEVRASQRLLLAQTYQNLAGGTLAELIDNLRVGPEVASNVGQFRPLNETQLNDEAADPAELLDAFLFQQGDTAFADALRAAFQTTGVPVITAVTRPEHMNAGATGLASSVRVKIQGKFLAP